MKTVLTRRDGYNISEALAHKYKSICENLAGEQDEQPRQRCLSWKKDYEHAMKRLMKYSKRRTIYLTEQDKETISSALYWYRYYFDRKAKTAEYWAQIEEYNKRAAEIETTLEKIKY